MGAAPLGLSRTGRTTSPPRRHPLRPLKTCRVERQRTITCGSWTGDYRDGTFTWHMQGTKRVARTQWKKSDGDPTYEYAEEAYFDEATRSLALLATTVSQDPDCVQHPSDACYYDPVWRVLKLKP